MCTSTLRRACKCVDIPAPFPVLNATSGMHSIPGLRTPRWAARVLDYCESTGLILLGQSYRRCPHPTSLMRELL